MKHWHSIVFVVCATAVFAQLGLLGAGSGSGPITGYTLVDMKATNANTNIGSDTCAGIFAPGTPSCTFQSYFAQGTGNVAVIGFGAQAASITAGQTLSVASDSSGSSWTHAASCATFFAAVSKVQDCWYTLSTAGSAGVVTLSVTIATPVTAGERIGVFYAEFHPPGGAGTGILDGIGTINDNVSCGNPTGCAGVASGALGSPTMSGTSDACVQWFVSGSPISTPLNAPWNLTTNGDHSAQATAQGLAANFPVPAWPTNANSTGIGTAICFR